MNYRVLLDADRDWTFPEQYDLTNYVEKLSWGFGMAAPYDTVAAPAFMELQLNNRNFELSDADSLFFGKFKKGTLIKVQMWQGGDWRTLVTLGIRNVAPSQAGDILQRILIISCNDSVFSDFLNREFIPPLLLDVRVDEALDRVHERAIALYPYENYYQFADFTSIDDGRGAFHGPDWTNFEEAETTLPYIGDNLDRGQGVRVSTFIRDAVGAEIYGLYFFDPRSEKFKFFNRYHASDEIVQWYLGDDEVIDARFSENRFLINDYSLTFAPRNVGGEGEILWVSDSVPIRVEGNNVPKRINVKFRDPDNPNAQIGALSIIQPLKVTDFTANELADGSGFDYTHRLRVEAIEGSTGAELVLTNSATGFIFATSLQLRGTPIRSYNKETVNKIDGESIFNEGRFAASETLYGISDEAFAEAYADFVVSVFSSPRKDAEEISYMITDETIEQAVNRTIGDVINFTWTLEAHDADYMIVAEKHDVNFISGLHRVAYRLRPTNRGDLFILGESTGDEGDVLGI